MSFIVTCRRLKIFLKKNYIFEKLDYKPLAILMVKSEFSRPSLDEADALETTKLDDDETAMKVFESAQFSCPRSK